MTPLIEVNTFVIVEVSALQGLLNVNDLVPLDVQLIQHLVVAL